MSSSEPSPPAGHSGARFVALGILTSRVFGLVRQKVFGFFFGVGAHSDVLLSALRLPNAIQNLLGEQSLSAAFIPIYSRFLAAGRKEDAARFAGAVFALLTAMVGALAVAGVLFARPIVAVFAAGFLQDAARIAAGEMTVDRYELTVRAVRILFPMTGFLVLASWALGVLNSHRRFFLPYLAPVAWNVAIIATLLAAAAPSDFLPMPAEAPAALLDRWLLAACWGALVGGFLQFVVQLPSVLRLLGGLRPSLSLAVPGVRQALAAFGPAMLGRGVVQIALYINVFLASFLKPGAPGAISFAILLINLPLAAFGMSVAAAELPELSRLSSREAVAQMQSRLDRALRQAAFVIAPSEVGYYLFGFLVVGLLYRGGRFTAEGNVLVYVIVVGYTLGLLASAIARILQNTFFAFGDTRTPARIAAVRLVVGALAGAGLMLLCDRYSVAQIFGVTDPAGDPLYLGAVGLAVASSIGAWVELALLVRHLRQRLPGLRLPLAGIGRMMLLAWLFALPPLLLWWLLPTGLGVVIEALIVLPLYPLGYLGFAWWRRMPEFEMWTGRLLRRR